MRRATRPPAIPVGRWLAQSRMSDPARYSPLVDDLPSEVGALIRVIQGLLIHADWLDDDSADNRRVSADARKTLPLAEQLDHILEIDPRPLHAARPLGSRSVGTCRDFSLMLCSFLRSRGVPARLRCGFASCFGDRREDHWVCEYRDRPARAWRLADAQLDEALREKLQIRFDPAEVPRESFMTAGEAWRECRAGRADPDRFGHGAVVGLWFVKVNVLRDHGALNGQETSVWDGWRDAPPAKRVVERKEIALLDRLAADPERTFVDVRPDWREW